MRNWKSLNNHLLFILSLTIIIIFVSSCEYRPLGKDACRFTLEDKSLEYIDWRIYPDNSTSSDATKLKYIDTNSFVCREKLQPGKYVIKMRRKGMGFTQRSVIIEDGKWDYILSDDLVGKNNDEDTGAFSVTATVDGAVANQYVNVLLLGQPTIMKEVQIKGNKLELQIPNNLRKYKICVILPDVEVKTWNSNGYLVNTENYNLGTITPK